MFDHDETLAEARARNVRDALFEDIGSRDWTGLLIPAERRVRAVVRVRESAVLCGRDWFCSVISTLDPGARIDWQYGGCAVLDTRKTLPGLRQAQKYAVRVGGGRNQRIALWHGILIKENHIAAAGGIAQVMAQALALNAGVEIQIEVETIAQLREALAAGATSVLLDNFTLEAMREAVQIAGGGAMLEVSGGVTLAALRDIAATGVDRVSIGRLTKDVLATDFSMRVVADAA